jgi:hypothetical protein
MDYTLQFDSQHRVLLITLGEVVTRVSALAAYTAVERFIFGAREKLPTLAFQH